jgi:hypothetical protein
VHYSDAVGELAELIPADRQFLEHGAYFSEGTTVQGWHPKPHIDPNGTDARINSPD